MRRIAPSRAGRPIAREQRTVRVVEQAVEELSTARSALANTEAMIDSVMGSPSNSQGAALEAMRSCLTPQTLANSVDTGLSL